MSLSDEIAAAKRDWEKWVAVNDDAAHDQLIRDAFEAGYQAGIEYATKESRESGKEINFQKEK